MDEAALANTFTCQPQNRNVHGRVFGGFLMRRAFELAHSTTYLFAGCRPLAGAGVAEAACCARCWGLHATSAAVASEELAPPGSRCSTAHAFALPRHIPALPRPCPALQWRWRR